MPVSLRPASTTDLPTVIDLLTSTFADDPGFGRIVGGGPGRERRVRDLLTAQLEQHFLPHGAVDLAELDGRLVGAAVWEPPRTDGSALDGLRLRVAEARALGGRTLRAWRRDRVAARHHPRFPHWYLYVIAVSPVARGRGIGSALVDHGTRRAGDDPVYLEATSTRSAALYERLGFVRLGEVPDHDDGPPEIAMWWPSAR